MQGLEVFHSLDFAFQFFLSFRRRGLFALPFSCDLPPTVFCLKAFGFAVFFGFSVVILVDVFCTLWLLFLVF